MQFAPTIRSVGRWVGAHVACLARKAHRTPKANVSGIVVEEEEDGMDRNVVGM